MVSVHQSHGTSSILVSFFLFSFFLHVCFLIFFSFTFGFPLFSSYFLSMLCFSLFSFLARMVSVFFHVQFLFFLLRLIFSSTYVSSFQSFSFDLLFHFLQFSINNNKKQIIHFELSIFLRKKIHQIAPDMSNVMQQGKFTTSSHAFLSSPAVNTHLTNSAKEGNPQSSNFS